VHEKTTTKTRGGEKNKDDCRTPTSLTEDRAQDQEMHPRKLVEYIERTLHTQGKEKGILESK